MFGCLVHRDTVKMRVRNDDIICEEAVNVFCRFFECRCAHNMRLVDSVYRHVHSVEVVLQID